MSELGVFSSPKPSVGAGAPSVTAQRKDVCRHLSDLGSSLISQSGDHYLLHLFAASKHNQPFLGISFLSKINSLILLSSTWKEKFPSASPAESSKNIS